MEGPVSSTFVARARVVTLIVLEFPVPPPLRYIEKNPVRAGMVADAAAYPWSSAAYHLLGTEDQTVMADYLHGSTFSHRDFFHEQDRAGDLEAIREAAQQGKAWGRTLFLERVADELGKVVAPEKEGGQRKKINICDSLHRLFRTKRIGHFRT